MGTYARTLTVKMLRMVNTLAPRLVRGSLIFICRINIFEIELISSCSKFSGDFKCIVAVQM